MAMQAFRRSLGARSSGGGGDAPPPWTPLLTDVALPRHTVTLSATNPKTQHVSTREACSVAAAPRSASQWGSLPGPPNCPPAADRYVSLPHVWEHQMLADFCTWRPP